MTIQKPRGTRDFLPKDMIRRRELENKLRSVVNKWGYQEVVTPTFENLELFTMKSGEGVIGELYNFTDKGNREMTLRPELTAPVMRLFVNEMQALPLPLKLFYFENCFRYERPQKGRFREFWQFGIELIGSQNPAADAEIIALATSMLKTAGIKGYLHVGYLGIIRALLNNIETEDQSKIMRFVDKKDYSSLNDFLKEINLDVNIASNLKKLITINGPNAIEEARFILGDIPEINIFEQIISLLDIYDIKYTIDFGISRGLDYYTGMVFEIYAEGLGAQKQVCGGGSYRLIKLFGGSDVPSTGFGLGFDRIMEIYDSVDKTPLSIVIITTAETKIHSIPIAAYLREYLPVHIDIMNRNFKAQLTYANAIKASHVLIIGEKEITEGKYTLKDMQSGEQELLTLEEIIIKLQD